MGMVYDEEAIKILEDNFYEYFANRWLFCKHFKEETFVNAYIRHGYCKKLKLEITESGSSKKFQSL